VTRTPSPPRPSREARQARSRDTQARIVQALRELVAQRAPGDIGVHEIAARAGVSVGGFYARFASKDHALAHVLYEGYVADAVRLAGTALDEARWEGQPIGPIVAAYFRLMVEAGRPHLPVVRELVHRTRENPEEMAGDPAWTRFREAVHAPFLRLMHARRGEITHRDPDLALRVGFSATSSALRETLLFGHMTPAMGPLSDDTLVSELTRMLCAYLGVRPPTAPPVHP
jgi:AcrR family transcriptional regulator